MEEQLRPHREKHWDELTDAEKIERMRGIVKHLRSQVDYLQQKTHALEEHRHGDGGELLRPFGSSFRDAEGRIRQSPAVPGTSVGAGCYRIPNTLTIWGHGSRRMEQEGVRCSRSSCGTSWIRSDRPIWRSSAIAGECTTQSARPSAPCSRSK